MPLEPPGFDPTVRPMAPAEAGLVRRIETASDRLLEPLGYWPLPPSTPEAAAAEARRSLTTLVAGRPAVGFSRIERLDGQAHLGQLSVLPEYGRMGVGRALVEATAEWARRAGYRRLTLTTFADVPFNAPWYRRLGFVELAGPYEPELARALDDERPLALLGRRVVMVRTLG
ncbi:MAG: GNAT family N-acetyltransferase [Acidimicrobiales bacterium]